MVGRMAVPEYDSHSVVHPGVASAPSELLLAGEPARRWVGVGHLLPNERDRRIPRHQPTSPAGSIAAQSSPPGHHGSSSAPAGDAIVAVEVFARFSHSPGLYDHRDDAGARDGTPASTNAGPASEPDARPAVRHEQGAPSWAKAIVRAPVAPARHRRVLRRRRTRQS